MSKSCDRYLIGIGAMQCRYCSSLPAPYSRRGCPTEERPRSHAFTRVDVIRDLSSGRSSPDGCPDPREAVVKVFLRAAFELLIAHFGVDASHVVGRPKRTDSSCTRAVRTRRLFFVNLKGVLQTIGVVSQTVREDHRILDLSFGVQKIGRRRGQCSAPIDRQGPQALGAV